MDGSLFMDKKKHYRRDRKVAACCQVKLGGYYPKNLLVIAIVARRLPQSSIVCMGGMMCLPTCLKHCTFYLCSQRHSFTTIWQVFADKSAPSWKVLQLQHSAAVHSDCKQVFCVEPLTSVWTISHSNCQQPPNNTYFLPRGATNWFLGPCDRDLRPVWNTSQSNTQVIKNHEHTRTYCWRQSAQ